MAGLVPAIPIRLAQHCPTKRDRRDKPGDDKEKPQREKRMPKAYWVSVYRSIKDPDKLAAYAKLAPPATTKFGAKYLCRGLPQMTYEAGQKERIVITEFPSLKDAIAAHDSPGYQDALKALGDGAVRDIRIIEALE